MLARFHDPPPTRSEVGPGRFVLVYDDGCGFCTGAARWIASRARRPIHLVGFSAWAPEMGYLTAVSPRVFAGSAHFITPSGREYHGGEAITKALRLWRYGWLVRPLDRPGGRVVRAVGYRFVRRHRGTLGRLRLPGRGTRSGRN